MTVPEETRTDADPACSNCGGGGWYLDEAQVRVCCPLCNADGNKRVDLADRTPQELAGIVRWALGATPKGDALAALARLVEAAEQAQRDRDEAQLEASPQFIVALETRNAAEARARMLAEDKAVWVANCNDAESRLRTAETALLPITDAAQKASAIANAPDYDEEAIKEALWDVVDFALAAREAVSE